ncbi:hypothetical protein OH77DRAFT_1457005 [Trametes cingulata]|nr:hypothetical protein OH77DRAFT_1457005 [Trametes cingulata]
MNTTNTSRSTTAITTRTYNVFAMAGYTIFLYDGGSDDHNIHLRSHVILREATTARSIRDFHGEVIRPILFQQDWILLEVRGVEEPEKRVCLAARYRKLGGIAGYLVRAARLVLRTCCLLSPNDVRPPLPPSYLRPFCYKLQLRRVVTEDTISSFAAVSQK